MRVSNSDYRAKKEIPWEILAPSFNTRCVARCPGPLASRGCFKSYIFNSIHVIPYRQTEKGDQAEKKSDRLTPTLSEAFTSVYVCWDVVATQPYCQGAIWSLMSALAVEKASVWMKWVGGVEMVCEMGPSVCWKLELRFPHSRLCVIVWEESMIACTSSKRVDKLWIFD